MWSGVVLCFSFLAQAGKVTVKALPSKSGAVNGIGSICDNVPGNLVANCGFETADFTSWAQSGNLAYFPTTQTFLTLPICQSPLTV